MNGGLYKVYLSSVQLTENGRSKNKIIPDVSQFWDIYALFGVFLQGYY